MNTSMNRFVSATALIAASAALLPAAAEISLPSVFSDHMVVQRDLPISVWGTAAPNRRISVGLVTADGDADMILQERYLESDAEGRWSCELQPVTDTSRVWRLEVGEFESDGRQTDSVAVNDVLVGEVWLCGGQSNMEWTMNQIGATAAAKSGMDRPRIRLIKAPHVLATEPQDDIEAEWQRCTPETVGNWSAVGLHFALDLLDELDVPVGLISSNWGGTRIEPWIERADLAAHPRFATRTAELQRGIDAFNAMDDAERARRTSELNAGFDQKARAYWDRILSKDPGMKQDWMSPGFDDGAWQTMNLPGNWEVREQSMRNYDGTVWFRRTVDIPENWTGRDLTLEFGSIDDSDHTWFDGTLVGVTTNQHAEPRRYRVPGELVKGGRAVITVCALDPQGGGGFNDGRMTLGPARDKALGLAGEWKWHAGVTTRDSGPRKVSEPLNPGMTPQSPGTLHDAMISPFVPYTMRGAIWYQGESNSGEPDEYRVLLPLLIESWREDFGEHLAFGIVQLAAFRPVSNDPVEGGWALLRDAQLETARTVPGTGLAVTTDVGDANDIHPRDKKTVGERLAGWALHDVYGVGNTAPSGPIHVATRREGDAMILEFDHAEGGLMNAKGGDNVGGFAVAGPDGRFVWAEAEVIGANSVRVRSNEITEPRIVRYGWQNNPVRADLYSGAGLPASPFRTDQP